MDTSIIKPSAAIKLTQTVQKGGCAAKVAAKELRKILEKVQFPPTDSNLMVDGGLFDDAAIYQVHKDLALVQTLDFFTPIVDTPYLFGQVATANALSDVYAMGGIPKTAMAILAFPLGQMDSAVIVEVLQGASDKMKEVGVNFVGGHSIDDDTLKFGLSVTGYVHPEKIWSNAKAKQGDILILTKALGTGAAMAGLKKQQTSEDELALVLQSMATVNNVLDSLNEEQASAIRSATDVTGFGLAGHAMQMAKASHKTFEFDFSNLPVFDIAWSSLEKGFLTKAHHTNAQYTEAESLIEVQDTLKKLILFDPQTSGGLLLSVAPALADSLLQSLKKRFPATSKIGRVLAPDKYPFIVRA